MSIKFLAIKASTIKCQMFLAERKRKRKNKQTNKLEDKKPNKNITQTNIKTHQEYKGGALTRYPNLHGRQTVKSNNENNI